MKTLRQEKGMVLLLVLTVVALLASLLTEFAFSTLVDLRLTETYRDSTKAYYLAKGGIQVGRVLLREDTNEYDATGDPAEMWSQGIPNYPVGDGVVSIAIEDLGGKLDINRLVDGTDQPLVRQMDRFTRLLEALGAEYPEGLTDNLIDWIDKNDDPRDAGAEDAYYLRLETPYPCKNGPLDTLDELAMVRGFTPEVLRLVGPHLTVHGGSKLNVNTASAEVLAAWEKDMTLDTAETIIAARESAPFKETAKLKEVIGVDSFSILNSNGEIGFTSPTYRISSNAGVGDGARTLEAVVEKNGDKLLYLKVN